MNVRYWLYRTGANPQKSLLIFIIGLALFFTGAYLLTSPLYFQLLLRILGYVLVLTGFLIAIRGWVGIFANRIALFINTPGGRFSEDKNKQSKD